MTGDIDGRNRDDGPPDHEESCTDRPREPTAEEVRQETGLSDVQRLRPAQASSRIVAFPMPPPSHIV